MDNDLNKFFVTFLIYKGHTEVNTVTVPRSLIHEMFQKWKFPGSQFEVRVVDHTGNYRINSEILNPR
jgi:hypothetical protein